MSSRLTPIAKLGVGAVTGVSAANGLVVGLSDPAYADRRLAACTVYTFTTMGACVMSTMLLPALVALPFFLAGTGVAIACDIPSPANLTISSTSGTDGPHED